MDLLVKCCKYYALAENKPSISELEANVIMNNDKRRIVCGFKAILNGETILSRLKEKEKAKKEYNNNVMKGNTAILTETKTNHLI